MPSKTLGEAINELDPEGGTPDGATVTAQTDSGFAADLFPPTFTTSEGSAPGGSSDGPVEATPGQTDLSLKALGTFSHYARENLAAENENYPDDLKAFNVEGKRGSEIVSPTGDNVYSPNNSDLSSTSTVSEYLTDKVGGLIDKTGANPEKLGSAILRSQPSFPGAAEDGFGYKSDPTEDAGADQILGTMAQSLMEEQSKYSPGSSSPYINVGNRSGEAALTGGRGGKEGHLFSMQSGNFGKFDPEGKSVTVKELRKAALQLLLQASNAPAGDAKSAANDIFKQNSGLAAASLIMKPFGIQSGGPHFFGVSVGGPNLMAVDKLRIRSTKAAEAFAGTFAGSAGDDLIAVKSFESNGPNKQSSADFLPDPNNLQTNGAGSSYGNLNNPSEPFGDFISLGMVMSTFINILILALMGVVISLVLGLIFALDKGTKTLPEAPWQMNMGSAAGAAGDRGFMAMLGQLFGIPRLGEVKFFDTLIGMLVLFGVPFNGGKFADVMKDVMEALINIFFGPGFYVVMARRVFSDWNDVGREFNKIGAAGGANSATQLLAFARALFSSKTIQFYFLCAQIGAMHHQTRSPGENAHGGGVIPLQDQPAHSILSPTNRNSMTRWHRDGTSDVVSTLSLHTFNSALLAGEWMGASGIGASQKMLPDPAGVIAGVEALPRGVRMTPEQLEEVESRIDGEYVPFSIHDVRTNEIISLPAFVSDIQDDFAVEYGTSQGFGRTDPVHVYGKTVRNLGFTFTLVAMNQGDHEYMWYVINRLIAMCYPQRDSGIKRFMEDGKAFIQPFSQAVAASPLVRVRLGDVIASNSSQRAFSRIFGGAGMLQRPASLASDQEKAYANAVALLESARDFHRGRLIAALDYAFTKSITVEGADQLSLVDPPPPPPGAPDYGGKLLNHPVVLAKGTPVYVEFDDSGGNLPSLPPKRKAKKKTFITQIPIKAKLIHLAQVGTTKTKNPSGGDPRKIDVSLTAWSIDLKDTVNSREEAYAIGGDVFLQYADKVLLNEPPAITIPPTLPLPLPPADFFALVERAPGGKCPIDWTKTEFLTTEAVDEFAELSTAENVDFVAAKAEVDAFGSDGRTPEELAEFLSPENNPLIRAFESSGGRGLAGFFTQMTLNYNDKLWGTTFEQGAHDKGLRAPKAVDITVQFAPVHDFPLGIDEHGLMFAPSHPVGVQSREKSRDFTSPDEILEKMKARAVAAVTYLPPPAEDP